SWDTLTGSESTGSTDTAAGGICGGTAGAFFPHPDRQTAASRNTGMWAEFMKGIENQRKDEDPFQLGI
ncbi:MAG: hypothetical protein CFE26_12500, partial [Verrucomicrobiales bacterium VVV1]